MEKENSEINVKMSNYFRWIMTAAGKKKLNEYYFNFTHLEIYLYIFLCIKFIHDPFLPLCLSFLFFSDVKLSLP